MSIARIFWVRPAWVITWWWKSTTGFAVGTVSEWQGCPPWGGIWRKSDANTRTDGQKSHIRLVGDGRACSTKWSPILHESLTVNEAVTWVEGYHSYPGRSYGHEESWSKACHKKSAEVIVPEIKSTRLGEGLNQSQLSSKWMLLYEGMNAENIEF